MIQQCNHQKPLLAILMLFASCIARGTTVEAFQRSNGSNQQSGFIHGNTGLQSSLSISQHHQRPLRFRSLVLVGDYETRPTLLPTLPPDDFLTTTGLTEVHQVPSTVPNRNGKPTFVSSDREADNTPSSSQPRTNAGIKKVTTINNRHSSGDWLYNLWTIPRSSVLREIRNPVLTLAGWATSIAILHKVFLSSPEHAIWASRLCISHAAHSFLVSSLGLLLVFRTNSAYQRFQEARKIWEQIHTVARSLSRMSMLYRAEVGPERLSRIQNLIASFPYLLRHHVRSTCPCRQDQDRIPPEFKLVLRDPSLQRVDSRYEGDKIAGGATRVSTKVGVTECIVDRRDLPWNLLDDTKSHGRISESDNHHPVHRVGNTLESVAKATNRPLWVCDRLGREIMGIPYGPNYSSRERLSLLSNVDKLTKAIGECERIHQTSVPLNYARHALRSLTIWLFSLPFCLVEEFGLLTGPVTALIAWLLFGVYQIGHSIEDPFQGSLRLSVLCDAIHKDVIMTEDVTHVDNHEPSFSSRSSAFDTNHDDVPASDYHRHETWNGGRRPADELVFQFATSSNSPLPNENLVRLGP